MSKLVLGAKIQFRVPNDSTWYDGVLHGIKKGDSNGKELILGYLVDTGNDAALSKWKTDQRTDEVNKRVNEQLDGTETPEQIQVIVDDVLAAKDLPKSKVVEHVDRQPEQYEVSRDNIRVAE